MIEAKVICDSVNPNGTRITTFELIYPRFIHSELMTHRVFSRNSASSRAIPISAMLDAISANPAEPVHWGKNQAGMQAKEELDQPQKVRVQALWREAVDAVVAISQRMADEGAHKQVANRITEFAQHMKIVLTSTQYENWFWLRDHTDADPTIKALAEAMNSAYSNSIPCNLRFGEWHLPYVRCIEVWPMTVGGRDKGKQLYFANGQEISLEEAKMISASCCAQVSYRKSDGSLEKAKVIFDRLIESEPVHASPVEHQAMCFNSKKIWDIFPESTWAEGITHIDREGWYWSGNFKDWIQHRQLIPNNSKNSW